MESEKGGNGMDTDGRDHGTDLISHITIFKYYGAN